MTKYGKFKAYFYNGFNKPKLVATSVTGLLREVKISDTYQGDMTKEMRAEVKAYKEGQNSFQEFKEYLQDFNIFINPTYTELKEASRQWFGNDTPEHHFMEFRHAEAQANKERNKALALSNVTRYKAMDDYKQDYETLEEAQADFDEKLENGYIQNITLSTYNGATQESTLYELTDENILEAIYTDLHETDSYGMIEEMEESTNLTKWDYIQAYTGIFNVFTLDGLVYIERD